MESPTSKLQVIEDRPLSNKASGDTQDVTQIQPQKLHITLRPGELQPPHIAVAEILLPVLRVSQSVPYIFMQMMPSVSW